MRFGVGDFSAQRPPDSPVHHRQLYAELLDQSRLIESAGLDSMWLSEHHFADDGYAPSVLPLAAALLARTERISVATDRLAASLYDPIRLAEDAIALDLLSGGRFSLGLSLCYRDIEFQGFGIDPSTDAQRLEALVPILRAAFSGEPVSLPGRPSVRVTPAPDTQGGPRLMIAADGQDGALRAGRLADLMMVDPTQTWSELELAVKSFATARGDRDGEVAVFVYGGLSEAGPEAAWAEVADGFRYMRHNYDRWMGRPPTEILPPKHYRMLLGTPASVAEQVSAYRKLGDRIHLVLRLNYPGMPAPVVAHQIQLWGEAASLSRDA
jgi:alkanesulfonate monooxygenase SsuD/methylene tetrahydromethanopterin reductase-like flavin-dependent oxidoreductase (luciferase family)